MSAKDDFHQCLEKEVKKQLRSQRVGYLLGAGSAHLGGDGYPLACELWPRIKPSVDKTSRAAIQRKLKSGAAGIEQALDQLDDGGATESGHREAVTQAIAECFRQLTPSLDLHVAFVERIAARGDHHVPVYSLNYDPLVERAADQARVRLTDGFHGTEHAFFDASAFGEAPYSKGNSNGRTRLCRAQRPIHLIKLHGSLGWYEGSGTVARRCAFSAAPPGGTRLLMVPPQRRKVADTMLPPYSALWSRFRGSLAHQEMPINRLACIGYGFGDHHVNEVIAPALSRNDFTLLIFAKALSDAAWNRWSPHENTIMVTAERCSIYGKQAGGHKDLWDFQRIAQEV